MLVSVSCTFGVVNEVITPASITPSIVDVSITTSDTIPNTEVPVTTTTTTTTKPIVVTPLVINKKEDLLNATSDIVYPAVIMFNNYIQKYSKTQKT